MKDEITPANGISVNLTPYLGMCVKRTKGIETSFSEALNTMWMNSTLFPTIILFL